MWCRLHVPVLLVATVTACTDASHHATGFPDHQNGTRLHAMILDGGSGARILERWYDAKFQLACTFQRANDGVLRCLPAATYPAVFADPQCTMRGVLLPMCGAVPTYVSLPASDTPTGCGFGHLAVYRVGSVANANLAYARDDFGSCGQVAFGSEAFHFVSDPVLASEFVPATTVDAAVEGGVFLRRIFAEDGAEQADALLDPTTNEPCLSSLLDDGSNGTGRCIPVGSPLSVGDIFSDAGCSQTAHVARIAIATGVDCPPASGFAVELHPPAMGSCTPVTFDVRPIGDPLPSTNLYTSLPTSCGPLKLSGPEELRALGAPVPPTMFGSLQITHQGRGPLQTNTFVTPNGVPIAVLPGTDFFDAGRGEPCATTTIDGTRYCVPKSATAQATGYADAACTQPLLVMPKAKVLCANGPPPTAIVGTGTCGYPFSVWKVGSLTGPAATYNKSSDGLGCQSGTIDPTMNYYVLSPSDATAFPPVTALTE